VRRLGLFIAIWGCLVSVAGCATSSSPSPSKETTSPTSASGSRPLLQPYQPVVNDAASPPAVKAQYVRQQRQGLALIKAADRAPATAAAGCVRGRAASSQVLVLGPPAPDITASIAGDQVNATFDYTRWSSSAGCKPTFLSAVVYSGQPGTVSFDNHGSVNVYKLTGRHGRIVVNLPQAGRPPYHLEVTSVVANNREGSGNVVALH
jgi:hypothetical protein